MARELPKPQAASPRRAVAAGSQATRSGNVQLPETRPPNGVLAAQSCGEFSGRRLCRAVQKKEPSAIAPKVPENELLGCRSVAGPDRRDAEVPIPLIIRSGRDPEAIGKEAHPPSASASL